MSTTDEQLSRSQQSERRKCINFLVEQEHPQSKEDAAASRSEWEKHSYEDLLYARRYNRKQLRRERMTLEIAGVTR
jgi:hypothetical protein